jgi:proline iminopeptidase
MEDTAPNGEGMLDVGDVHRVHWETWGSPAGRAAVVLHGGPGSGASRSRRDLFDLAAWRVVLFDQRGCGRSTPHAGAALADLSANTTAHLVADIERLRRHLEVERWLVVGASWGSTLALAYAEAHPQRVTGIVLSGVTTGRRSEADWLFRGGVARFFPAQWQRLCDGLAERECGDVPAAYHALLMDPDPAVRVRAAEAWCRWESATIDWPPADGLADRFRDPAYALAFSRIVTWYVSHDLWLEDGCLLRGAGALSGIPGVLVNGRFDFQAPIGNAWELQRAWPRAELVIVDDAGHEANDAVRAELRRAIERVTA